MTLKIKIIELFAGVGGFRLGLEKASSKYKVVWSNQWEPSTKSQIASEIYVNRFGLKNHSNMDITKVPVDEIPNCDLVTGGFPCQDYSVASTLSNSKGLEGKKGVLWWTIHRILENKNVKYIFLENVDRLLKSPVKQRGRDFAIMLASLSDLGYIVEWRVINASDYGYPQKRKRTYILAYKDKSKIYKEVKDSEKDWVFKKGIFAKSFPIDNLEVISNFTINGDLVKISNDFNKDESKSPFKECGLMINRTVFTAKYSSKYKGKFRLLKDIVLDENEVPAEFFVDKKDLEKWTYLKGAKKILKKSKSGYEYYYAEGKMAFPDSLDKPARTIITGEGGSSPSRFKHIIKTKSGKFRRLMPVELERINMFPDNHTKEGTDNKRAFLMGNALVVGVIEKIALELAKRM